MIESDKKENRIKLYGIIIGILSAIAQHGIYLLAHSLSILVGVNPFLPKLPLIDDAIPIVPLFIIPYVWAYLFWAMAPMAASKCKLDHFLDYLAAYLFACIVGAVILIFAPTYMDRVQEGLYDPSGTGPLYSLMRLWYSMDGGDIAYNLFPSFHCINSAISYLAVAGRKEVPKWFRIYSFITMILIFCSTLFVKQHFVLDVCAGAAISFVTFFICKKVHAGRIFLGPINFFKKLFSKKD